jgi:threonine dehydratase
MEQTLLERAEVQERRGTESQVRACLELLMDESSELHQLFYGEQGVTPTPLTPSAHQIGSHETLCKNETDHSVELNGETYRSASFKRRGAFLDALSAYQQNPNLAKFVTASHGNHAIGVAIAGHILGIPVEVHCPRDTHEVKQAAILSHGATLENDYDHFEDAMAGAESAVSESVHLAHPFDRAEVMAGQGTIMLEIYKDLLQKQERGELDLHSTPIVIGFAVAGGGLLAGNLVMLRVLQDKGLVGQNVTLLGAQMVRCDAAMRCREGQTDGDSYTAYFAPGEFDASCDSTAVKSIGHLSSEVLDRYSVELRRVSKTEVAQAMRDHEADVGGMSEPAGGLARAALKQYAEALDESDPSAPKPILIDVICGANVTKELYEEYMNHLEPTSPQRAELADEQEAARQAFHALSQEYLYRKKHGVEEVIARNAGQTALRVTTDVWRGHPLR